MASHFGGDVNLHIIHIVLAVFLSIYFIHFQVFCYVQNDRVPFPIFSQIMKNLHFVKLLEIFPFILTSQVLLPFLILFYCYSSFFYVVIFVNQKSANGMLMFTPKLFFQTLVYFHEFRGNLTD